MIKDLILRRTPDWAELFLLEAVECENEIWSYEPAEGKVLLKGSNAICMAVAYYEFLREYCGAYFDAEHALCVGELNMPPQLVSGEIAVKYRTCFEYTTFSCAACWWTWERWENEIDFMAMNGINMPLTVVGTAAVWLKTMLDMGIKEKEALAGLSGPAFWGWQLYNCFDGYLPQVQRATVEKQIELGRKIFEREKQLGMQPLMHGYSGYIPRVFIQAKIRARVNKSDEWCLFPVQYQVSALDAKFHRFGSAYYKNLSLLIGEGAYFLADPFTAHAPAKRDSAFLAGLGTAIYKLIALQGEDACWVIHSSSAKKAMFSAVPKDKLIVIDGDGLYEKEGLEEYSFILSSSFNSGDVTALHGDFALAASTAAAASKAKNVVGTGAFSDGAHSNEAFRQFSYAALCSEKAADEWLKKYASNRYKTNSSAAFEAMQLLVESCWEKGQPKREHGSAICTRPSTLLRHTSIGDSGNDISYDISKVFKAAQKLIEADGKTYEYELDVCDVLRQALSDLANTVCKKALDGYKKKDVKAFEENSNLFLQLIEDLDRLMMTKKEFALPYHLKAAADFGSNAEESQNFEINVLAQTTHFGPVKDTVLYDTCWKEWGGSLKTFYGKRWRAMFEYLAANFKKFRRIPEKTRTQAFERDAYLGSEFGARLAKVEKEWVAEYSPEYDSVAKEDTLAVAKELVAKYAPNF